MRTLIVDNGTNYLAQLKRLVGGLADIISYSEITKKDNKGLQKYDLVVLSGGHNFPVVGNERRLASEISLIKNRDKPLFGICYGFELIAAAFGAKLKQMKHREKGILEIRVKQKDELFSNMPNFKVYESHRWVVEELPRDLSVLAESKDGIEAIRHKTLTIYGVQFHPEMFIDETCGDEIFHNFLTVIKTADRNHKHN